MPLMQEDIKEHYERQWKQSDETAQDDSGLAYSNPVEDAVLYPLYQQLLADLKVKVDLGRVLDVGAGSGRWVRYFLERFKPALLMGIDFTTASIELLQRRYANPANTKTDFRTADLTQANLELGHRFDLINVMNVLFHIPEPDRFTAALANLARHLAPGGRIVTTEYMPRTSVRTNWMLVRSRYDFEAAVNAAGLRIVAVKAASIYSNDPLGLEGRDDGLRGEFNRVRGHVNQIFNLPINAATKAFFVTFLAEVESSMLNFCKERLADVEMPSQKLVVLAADRI